MKEEDALNKIRPPVRLTHGLYDYHFAVLLANLTIHWGHIEYQFYQLLSRIDEKRAQEFLEMFFGPLSTNEREKIVKKRIDEIMNPSRPKFIALLDKVFVDLKDVQRRRNPLAHGLWTRTGPESFEVIPMRLERTSKKLATAVKVDVSYVVALIEDVEKLESMLWNLTTEMIANRFMEKIESRRRAAAAEKPT